MKKFRGKYKIRMGFISRDNVVPTSRNSYRYRVGPRPGTRKPGKFNPYNLIS